MFKEKYTTLSAKSLFVLMLLAQVACQKQELPKNTILPTDYWSYRNLSMHNNKVFLPLDKWTLFNKDIEFTSSYYQVCSNGNSNYMLCLFFNEEPEAGLHQVVDKYAGTNSDQLHVMVTYRYFEIFDWDYGLEGEVDVKVDSNGNRRFIMKNILTEYGATINGDLTLN